MANKRDHSENLLFYPEQSPADFGRFHSNPLTVFVLNFKTGHCEVQIRPPGIKTGQYRPKGID